MSNTLNGREVLIEMHRIGAYVRVTAMDAQTMVEAVVTGAANAPESILRSTAVKKLEFLLRKAGHIA